MPFSIMECSSFCLQYIIHRYRNILRPEHSAFQVNQSLWRKRCTKFTRTKKEPLAPVKSLPPQTLRNTPSDKSQHRFITFCWEIYLLVFIFNMPSHFVQEACQHSRDDHLGLQTRQLGKLNYAVAPRALPSETTIYRR